MAVPISTLPDTSPLGFLSYWFSTSAASGNEDSGSSGSIIINHVNQLLRVTLRDDDGSNVLERWSDNILPLDDKWHNVMISWDTQQRQIKANLDGLPIELEDTHDADQGGPDGFDITYKDQTIRIGGVPNDATGGDPDNSDFYIGMLDEIYFIADFAIDVADPVVIAKFIKKET